MFAIAQELRDPRTAGKTCQFSLPNSFKSKVYETSNLIKVTKSKIPAKGIDMGQVNDQMDIFDKVMTLPNGKSVFKIITTGNKSSENNEVFTTHNDHHNDHQHNQKSKVEKMGDKLEQCDIL
ncbi:MAG TPA: hypothetical protein LFW20_05280 [Rickettsia endosymbiont of Omalisus fontisbellaquei]|nr:hypothetical protein [Rickettsia endosymbiont of Omalisus fontisbellaquei]